MMCDVMPTISEDVCTDQDSNYSGDGDANFEQLMVKMLDERDKLMDTLSQTQETLGLTQARLQEVERERDALNKQMQSTTPLEYAQLSRELNQVREQLLERDEEVTELKAERNNTRLLLEHLECLVSRHERSLRMTIVKRQAASPAGVSSEVEVLKALKSLFEHHKALDEKVREQLRTSLERVVQLEEELAAANHELFQFREEKSTQRHSMYDAESTVATAVGKLNRTPSGHAPTDLSINVAMTAHDSASKSGVDLPKEPIAPTRLANGSADPRSDASRMVEFQGTIEKQAGELTASWSRIVELEEALAGAQKEVARLQELHVKLQRSLRESVAQKEDQEERIATLEKRYLNAQRESTSVHDLNDKLESELAVKEAQLKSSEEKVRALVEKIDMGEVKMQQIMNKDDVVLRQQDSLESLDKNNSVAEKTKQLETQLDDANTQLQRARQQEKMNEEHNARLSATVDKLLTESNERLQLHLKERMQALEEKTQISKELEKIQKSLDDTQQEKDSTVRECDRLRQEIVQLKAQLEKIRSEGHSRYGVRPGAGVELSVDSPTIYRRSQRGREQALKEDPTKVNTMTEQEWEKVEQAQVLASVQHAFDASDTEGGLADDGFDPEVGILPTGGHTDAQTLALMLQEQLDAINNEIRLIQEEKETTEQRAEEIECRVVGGGGGMISGIEPMMPRWHAERSFERSSPPQSGRSTPTARSSYHHHRDFSTKYHTAPTANQTPRMYTYSASSPHLATSAACAVDASTAACMGHVATTDATTQVSNVTTPAISHQESVGSKEDTRQIKCESSPPTPRSLRLERVAEALAQTSDEHLHTRTLPAHAFHIRVLDGAQDVSSPGGSMNSSQDSLHKQSSKKKSGKLGTLGRIFSKKESQKYGTTANAKPKDGKAVRESTVSHTGNQISSHPEVESGSSDALGLGLGKPTEFDRRKKKKVPTATLR